MKHAYDPTWEYRLPKLLTEAQVAAILQVRKTTLRDWRCKGKGPEFVKVGQRLVRYTPEALQKFVGPRVPRVRPALPTLEVEVTQ